ncbi:hypothetical protein YTPLAS72_35710 [Nitrospira sp.]|nr:hypothetical protein YTPLAS72_35710 [Nitrospira sp.]
MWLYGILASWKLTVYRWTLLFYSHDRAAALELYFVPGCRPLFTERFFDRQWLCGITDRSLRTRSFLLHH